MSSCGQKPHGRRHCGTQSFEEIGNLKYHWIMFVHPLRQCLYNIHIANKLFPYLIQGVWLRLVRCSMCPVKWSMADSICPGEWPSEIKVQSGQKRYRSFIWRFSQRMGVRLFIYVIPRPRQVGSEGSLMVKQEDLFWIRVVDVGCHGKYYQCLCISGNPNWNIVTCKVPDVAIGLQIPRYSDVFGKALEGIVVV